MTVTATTARGCTVKIGNGASPEVFTLIAKIDEGPEWDGWTQEIIEAFHHDSNTPIKKLIRTNVGPFTIGGLFDSGDTQHLALQTAARTGAYKNFEITMTDTGAQVLTFNASVTFGLSMSPEGWNRFRATLTPTDGVTVA